MENIDFASKFKISNRSMEESKGLRGRTQAHERLKADEVANFPGSILVNHVDEALHRTGALRDRGKVADWVTYCMEGWDDVGIWKSAVCSSILENSYHIKCLHVFVEMAATCLLFYVSSLIDKIITNFQTKSIVAVAAICNIFLLTLFIIAVVPGSGGHNNPLITFWTMLMA